MTIWVSAATEVAIATKVAGTVELKGSAEKEFHSITPGRVLKDKDHLKTGQDGFAILVYLDDKSTLKIKENSSIEISGQRGGGGLAKRIDMINGVIKADISSQKKGEFSITTPTSVASVKGTLFWMISNSVEGDQVIGLEGVVEMTNLISGQVMNVQAGQTVTSTPSGDMAVVPTDAGSLPEDQAETQPQINELRIRLRNAEGVEKVLIIQYQ